MPIQQAPKHPSFLRNAALKLARWLAGRRTSLTRDLIAWSLAHMSFTLPIKKLRETPTLLAFHHPSPAYPVHILLVPKKAVTSLAAPEASDPAFLQDLLRCVQELVQELGLEESGYRLIVNGGKFQEMPQLHFHLVGGEENTA